MIKSPQQMTFTDKKFSMIVYGSPGIGKTTLALSAPDPILIDFENGVDRVRADHRKLTIVCENYEEVLHDIESPEVRDCQSVIIDTGGAFITYLKDWALRTQPGCKQKNGEFNSLKGYGVVKNEFASFTSRIRDAMHKNVIYIFHADEKADKDGNAQQRLLCEGATKNSVWNSCDFGGYMQMIGDQRTIAFTPTQEYFAKGSHGITGILPVPDKSITETNDFLSVLFDKAKANIAHENDVFAPMQAQYDAVMKEVREVIGAIQTADDANAAAAALPEMNHALSSKREASMMLKEKANSLGLKWDAEAKSYRGIQ